MKHLLLLLSLIFTQIALPAQVISLTPTPVDKAFQVDLSDPTLDLELHVTVKNDTTTDILLKWTRIVKNAPLDWDTQVCDNNFCYLPHVNSNIDPALNLNEPFKLRAGESFDLIFHVLPNGTPGEGNFELVFALAEAPDTPIDTAIFNTTVNLTTSAFDLKNKDIRVFPNPATSYFELTDVNGVDQIKVYNMLGREVRSYRAYTRQQYNVADLPDGLYLISLMNDRKGIVKTVRLNKRGWRP